MREVAATGSCSDSLTGNDSDSDSVRVYSDPYLACHMAHAVLVITDCDQFGHPSHSPTLESSDHDIGCGSDQVDPGHQDEYTINGQTYHLKPIHCPPHCPTCAACHIPVTMEPLEWPSVAYNMREPKWVFDGRGIVDVRALQRLGLRVDVVGR